MIAVGALVARLVLAGVFLVAGLTKLGDRRRTRDTLTSFGTPARLAPAAAFILPLAELTIAGLLVVPATAAAGAIAAIALLACFTGAIALNLARGRKPECNCFGQIHSTPIGPKTLARNGGLIALAAAALAGVLAEPAIPNDDLSAAAWAAIALGFVCAATVGVGTLVIVKLLRSYGQVLVRLERVEGALADLGVDVGEDAPAMIGLDPGSEAPWFLTTRIDGTAVSRDDIFSDERPTLLLFTSPHCGPCLELMPEIAAWQAEHAGVLDLALATDGTAAELDGELGGVDRARVLLDARHELYETFQASGTPSAVLVTTDRRIGSWVVAGREAIADLVERATAPEPEPAVAIGAAIPPLALPTLDGDELALADLVDRPTVALFWNPGCGYCQAMLEDLRGWERQRRDDEPRLVVISSGTADDTHADGFASTVLLDEEFAAGNAFGANGTPMGVLLAPDGTVASAVVAGSDDVLGLLRARAATR